ncbi:sugar ABC transporter ATP-binding protein [Ensifer canadensis]|uniref:sugar ABC transporter ATP-binding protein n=1 Tax=Ensifer canadensis TaxID=555315 RepID=UPI0035E3E35C
MRLQVNNVCKSFGATQALRGVDLSLNPKETVVLFGENGAGKSTLVKILSGAYKADSGTIVVNGERVQIQSPNDARKKGIATVFQEFSLAPSLSVLDNLFLGRERSRHGLLDRRRMRQEARAIFDSLGVSVDLDSRVDAVDRATQQMVEIAKSMLDEACILILDEPTSSLTESETRTLFSALDRLKDSGCGIIYISHRMEEVLQQADRVTVLRDGETITSFSRGQYSEGDLIKQLIGQDNRDIYPAKSFPTDQSGMSIDGLCAAELKDISFTLHRGEILGVAGLTGSGTTQLGRALFGLDSIAAGSVRVGGTMISEPSPRRMLDSGVIYFSSNRLDEGILPTRSVSENIAVEALDSLLSRAGVVMRSRQSSAVASVVERLKIKASPGANILELSGGNQQKAVLARGMLRKFNVMIMDDPTIGVDLQTKREIYQILQELAAEGAAILLISSDIEELIGLSHRILVLCEGRMAADAVETDATNKPSLLKLFFPRRVAESSSTRHLARTYQ